MSLFWKSDKRRADFQLHFLLLCQWNLQDRVSVRKTEAAVQERAQKLAGSS